MKKFKSTKSPQLRVPEDRTIARLKILVLGLNFAQVRPCRPASPSPEFVSFSGTPAGRGLVGTTEYYWGLLQQDLLWKGMWLVFLLVKDF